jgi:lipopolysaccharide export system protein LptA
MTRRDSRRLPAALAALILPVALGGFMAPALAEKADRNKPVNIESDRMNADDAKKTAIFEGRVVLTQGTLTIRADRITVRQDKDGFQYGTAVGGLATFRQKRDGVNEYVEAEAERIEYDAKAERVEFFERAHLRRDSGDDVRGSYISYDARTEFFTVGARRDGAARDASKSAPQERVRATIQPRNTEPTPSVPATRPAP